MAEFFQARSSSRVGEAERASEQSAGAGRQSGRVAQLAGPLPLSSPTGRARACGELEGRASHREVGRRGQAGPCQPTFWGMRPTSPPPCPGPWSISGLGACTRSALAGQGLCGCWPCTPGPALGYRSLFGAAQRNELFWPRSNDLPF